MRLRVILLAVVLTTVAFPTAVGNHLSVGVQDAPGVSEEEGPGSPTVPSGAYDRGTTLEGCFESEGNVSNTSKAVGADGFCGNLIYHKDIPELTHISAPDQDFPGGETTDYNTLPDEQSNNPIGTWDVVRTHHQGWELSTCLPICSNDTIQGESGEILWDAVHDAGAALNLTHDGETSRRHAENQTDNRWQTYGPHIQHPMAAHVVQDTTGVWEFNGWTSFSPVQGYIGFLYDHNNDPITDEELRTLVEDMKDPSIGQYGTQLLPESAAPLVCGFTPNFEFTNTGNQPGTQCEFEFQYRGHHENDGNVEDGFKDEDGYERRCSSPTYICEPTNERGGAWYYSNGCLCLGYTNPGGNVFIGDEGGQTGYLKWHWVVAPHASACNGAQQPGMAMQSSSSAEYPYLSHDLDIYTPITSLSAWQNSSAVPSTMLHLFEVTDRQIENAQDAVDEATPGEIDQAISRAEAETSDTVNQTWRVEKDDRTEPNSNLQLGTVADDSQNLPVAQGGDLLREFGDVCDILTSEEDPHTVDPWANLIDSETYDIVDEEAESTSGLTEWDELTYYGDDPNKHQDDGNTPGPGLYATTGNIGMFADKGADGSYSPLPPDHKNEGRDMAEAGAWPMHWMMWLSYNETEQQYKPDFEDGGCRDLTHANTPFTEHMVKSGFGPDTGLIQGIYLEEATAFVEPGTQEVVEYPEGNNIYLFLSPGVQTLIENNATTVGTEVSWDPDGHINWDADFDPAVWEIAQETEKVVRELKAHAAQQEGISEPSVGVHIPVLDTTQDWGFDDQCSESTGGFSSNLDFVHQCETGCQQDAIVTAYTAELTDGTVGGDVFPPFTGSGDTPYDFGDRVSWTDVDAFNGDPDTNLVENTAPCGEDGHEERIECPRTVRDLSVAETTAENVTLDWEPAPEVANLTADHGDIVYNVYKNGSSSQHLVAEDLAVTQWTDEAISAGSNTYEVSYNVTAKYQYATPNEDIPDREGPTSEVVATIQAE